MQRQTLPLPILALAAMLIASCGPRPIVHPDRFGVDLSQYSHVRVTVDAEEFLLGKRGTDATLAELSREFIEQVRASGKFAVVDHLPGAGKGLDVRLTIKALVYVSGGDRGVDAAFPVPQNRRAILNVAMALTDKETGAVVLTFAAGDVSKGSGPFSPTTGRQISVMAKELSDRLNAAVKNR